MTKECPMTKHSNDQGRCKIQAGSCTALFRLLPGGGGPIIFWRAQPFPVRGRVLANLANFDHEWRLIIMSLSRNGEIGSKNGIVRPHSPALARISPHLPALRN